MEIAILLYEQMTALDAIGPYEILSRLPGANLRFVGAKRGLVRTDTGFLRLEAEVEPEEATELDLLLIPGGPGDEAVRADERILDWIGRVHPGTKFTTSVCTGSLILAAAGVLNGLRATTHWTAMDELASLGAVPTSERVVQEGKVVTAAGVSAGIDMALTIAAQVAGHDFAQALQLGIEYDPQPPFQAGSPSTAPEAIVALTRQAMART